MEQSISELLQRYESGTLTRRQLIGGLAMLAATGKTTAATGFQAISMNHASLQVSNLNRSKDFYSGMFGLQVLEQDDKLVRLGQPNKNFLTLRLGMPAGRVDHFGFGVAGFDENAVMRDLRDRGGKPENDPAIGLHVKDPDGFPAQVIENNR